MVLLHGPRQCGKTTLARTVAEPAGYGYLSFDDDNLVVAAKADPLGFVADLPPRMVLDGVVELPWFAHLPDPCQRSWLMQYRRNLDGRCFPDHLRVDVEICVNQSVRMPTMAFHGMALWAARVSTVILLAASPMISMARMTAN